jgi:hypothetical protein
MIITAGEIILLTKLGLATVNAFTARSAKKKKKLEIRDELKKKLAALRAQRGGPGSPDPAA